MIAREGRIPVGVTAVAGAVVAYFLGPLWSSPLWLLLAGLVWLFFARRVSVSNLPLAVVAPIDGKVIALGTVRDPWLKRSALRIGIGLGVPGVSVLFSPVDGKISGYWTDLEEPPSELEPDHAGEDVASMLAGVLDSPTMYALAVKMDGGDDVVYCVSSANRHSRLKFDQAPGERAAKGHRSGFVYFATRVDVLVPPNSLPRVEMGSRLRAGVDTIANLVHG